MDSPEEVDTESPTSSNGLSRAQKLLANVMKIFESTRSETSDELSTSLFEKKEEMELNRFLQHLSNRSNHHHPNARRSRKEPSKRLPKELRMRPSPRRCPHVPVTMLTHESTLSNSQHYSRAKVMSSLAKKRDKKQWSRKIQKEEEEKRASCVERTNILSKFGTRLETMKTRLSVFLEGANISNTSSTESLCEEVIHFKDKIMVDRNQCILSLAQAIVHLIFKKLQCDCVTGLRAQEYFENIFYMSVSKVKLSVIDSIKDEDALYYWLRECQLQILYRMETSWLLLGNRETLDTVRSEIVDFLKILSVYCREPKVQDFLSDVLVLGYLETLPELLVELFQGIHMDPPGHLLATISPNKEKSIFGSSPGRSSFGGSSASPFGSEPTLRPPASTLKYNNKNNKVGLQRFPTHDSLLSRSSARYTNHVYVNNPKKMILVPVPKTKTVLHNKKGSIAKSPNMLGNSRGTSKPKTIRRNLFHVDKTNKPNDTKALLSLTSTSLFSRSPSVSSPRSYNKMLSSQSPKNRSLRSKRRLDMDSCDDAAVVKNNSPTVGSPDLFSPPPHNRIICPATPSYKPGNSCKKMRRSLSYCSSGGKKVIMESPDMGKQAYPQSFSQVVHSLSFYSTGSGSFKSRAWEKSGSKMLQAKIKRTIDSSSFMNSGLTLSDLEITGCLSSPDCKSVVSESLNMSSGIRTPKVGGEEASHIVGIH